MLAYWFDFRPLAFTLSLSLFIAGAFIALTALGVGLKGFARRIKKHDRYISRFWKKVSTACVTMGVVGICLAFFSYQGIPLFNMRAWYLAWIIVALSWGGWLLEYRWRKIPRILAANHEAAIKEEFVHG